jgi:hypothetical protein
LFFEMTFVWFLFADSENKAYELLKRFVPVQKAEVLREQRRERERERVLPAPTKDKEFLQPRTKAHPRKGLPTAPTSASAASASASASAAPEGDSLLQVCKDLIAKHQKLQRSERYSRSSQSFDRDRASCKQLLRLVRLQLLWKI